MRALRPLAAVGFLLLCSISFLAANAAEGTSQRPFGGPPPPKSRKIEAIPKGTICKTPTVTCKLEKAQPVGAVCSCPESDGKSVPGKVVEQSS